MKKIIIFILMILPLMNNAQTDCSTIDSIPAGLQNGCTFIIDEYSDELPLFTIKMAIHFIADGYGNFYDGSTDDWNKLNGTTQALLMINKSNYYLQNLVPNPIQNDHFLGDSRIRFEVVPNFEDGVYFWDKPSDYVPVQGVLNVRIIDEYYPGRLCDSNDPSQGLCEFTFRGKACGINRNCNYLRMWGWQSNEKHDQPWHFWNYAGLLNHEVLHTLGLNHSWESWAECSGVDINHNLEAANGKWDSGSKNIMNYVANREALSPCQWKHIYTNLFNDKFSWADIDCNETFNDIIIAQDETWDEKMVVMGDVKILNDATLTVKCTVELNTGSQIFVESGGKLIVDGGTLTSFSHCGVALWDGIKVDGGNADYDVKTYNDATIENTSDAAVSMFPNLAWPMGGNGILHADNTVFNNCKRMVEFISFDPSPNSSHVNKCVQNGGKWGITNWNCQGIVVTDNVFNDITDHCILTEAGSFDITGNEFHSGLNDILYLNTSAGYNSIIEDNDFFGLQTGYRGIGTTIGHNVLKYNRFHSGLWNIFMDGDNHYLIESNEFHGAFNGVVSASNGTSFNKVTENDFIGNDYGLSALFTNSSYLFLENCFESNFADAYIIGDVADNMRTNINEGAGNCFTHQGNAVSNVKDIDGTPDPFNYYEPNPMVSPECLNAILAHPNVSIIYVPYEGNGCLPGNPAGNTQDNDNSFMLEAIDQNRTSTSNNVVASFDSKQAYSSFQVSQKHLKDRIKRRAKHKETISSISTTSDDEVVGVFSDYILDADLLSARTYIESIEPISEQLTDFVTIQLLNLERLENGPSYQFDAQKLATINTIAQKQHPYAAYAKSLYFVLTQVLISTDLPPFLGGELQTRGQGVDKVKTGIAYPNPFNEKLVIDIKSFKDVNISIVDFSGHVVFHRKRVKENIEIVTSDWNSGLYVVTLKKANEVLQIDKCFLIK